MTDDQETRRRPPPFPLSPFSSSFPSSFLNHRRHLLRRASLLLCFCSPVPPPWLCLIFPLPPTTRLPSLPLHHYHGRLLSPQLLFLLDPSSVFLLFLSFTGDLPCSLFFLYCQSLSNGATMAESMVVPAESFRSPFPPYFPSMPPVTTHFFYLHFLLYDVIDVILIVVALLCCGDAFPPPSSSSPSPSAPTPLCHHRRDQIVATTPPHLPPLPQLPRKQHRCRIPSPLWLPFLRPLAAAMISEPE